MLKRTIEVNGRPYLTRYYLFGREWPAGLSLYLHHFHASDQLDELHNHPWQWGLSFVLSGGYIEHYLRDDGTVGQRTIKPGMFNWIGRNKFHAVQLTGGAAWSIMLVGPRLGGWGFFNPTTGVFRPWFLNKNAIA